MLMPALEPTVDAWKRQVDHDRIKQEWAQLSGRLLRRWRKLTADDVLFAGGSAEYLARVLQDRYGVDRREAMLQVYEFESGL
jgi:uncharacterized protein YjbJ (UPF0337 family)